MAEIGQNVKALGGKNLSAGIAIFFYQLIYLLLLDFLFS